MREVEYLQMRAMVEQNAFRKALPWMLAITLLSITSTGLIFFGILGYFVTNNLSSHEFTIFILSGLPFIVAIATIYIFAIEPIKKLKIRQLNEISEANTWAKEQKKDPTFFLSIAMKEYYEPAV
jgi:hydrogenase-4 membrane subunit HyfE